MNYFGISVKTILVERTPGKISFGLWFQKISVHHSREAQLPAVELCKKVVHIPRDREAERGAQGLETRYNLQQFTSYHQLLLARPHILEVLCPCPKNSTTSWETSI